VEWSFTKIMRNPEEASFILIPGAGGMAWYWHRVVDLLEGGRREAIAVELPGDDDTVGLRDYAEIVVRSIGKRANVILVAQSLGGFTAPLACQRAAVRMLIFVNAMVPLPGETPGAWWKNTGAVEARMAAAESGGYSKEFDVQTYFLHDVPREVLQTGPARQREQSEAVFQEPCMFHRWPEIPMHVIASENDRFFPLEFQRRVAHARLNTEVEVLPGGHLVALSNPQGLVDRLLHVERQKE
jgi:pimeloyl-ACP methyl ester carboxylesterase